MNSTKIEPSDIDPQWTKTGESSWIATLCEDPVTGDLILPLPDEIMQTSGFALGDTLDWTANSDGSFSLTKKVPNETEWVLVECVTSYRMRYMVEVPVGKSDWALDTVALNEATEFSQEHIGEQIVSHRVISQHAALELCDKDNMYASTWSEGHKIATFFTKVKESK
jgi:hypothetical protein